jgi:hypothetical protein
MSVISQVTPPNLSDPSLFIRKPRVPILTVHTREHVDPETKKSWTSKLDADQLAVLYRNTFARRQKGEVPQLFVGHTVRGAPETAQPPGVGYVDIFTLGLHEGRPAMLADLFIKKQRSANGLKRPVNLEVASEACIQAFGASTTRKRLDDQPLEAPRFSTGF